MGEHLLTVFGSQFPDENRRTADRADDFGWAVELRVHRGFLSVWLHKRVVQCNSILPDEGWGKPVFDVICAEGKF
ncbi:hypothetical protein BCCH1_31630 [Burkholderia contaminans]|uniref:Uncharacterized protein n=1 Tax=Burkholderia contaminans TaxID=488447 RepID=A0A250LB01_9BURK|nr:hypothetical protein BCCH1_31630 [Burkholderia contaminans]GLZ73451.1 hypothetical protein Bcon01_64960 [Burkholderia contaminans]